MIETILILDSEIQTKVPSAKDWHRFLHEGMTNWTESNESNVKYDFSKMTKLFGLSYIYYLECEYLMYKVGGGFTFEELCLWNGRVPERFFLKFKKA
jgi:hypothetical protein